MMMLSEIANALNAHVTGQDVSVLSIGTDSRNIKDNQLFVAIKGDRFDGNRFAAEAVQLGAAAALISDANTKVSPSVLVKDTRLALGALAHCWRKKFSLPLVAVTGSNGKTTVKEMIASILSTAKGHVLATQGNLNNDIGMPLSLLNIRAEHTNAVIEMGMSHLGEIRYLTNIACPQVAVVNNAGTAHIGELGSRKAIAEAKGEVFEGLAKDGIAVINADDDFAEYWLSLNEDKKVITFGLGGGADVTAQYSTEGGRSNISLKTPDGTVQVSLSVLGKHNVSNALAASAVAVALGVSNADIAQGLSRFNGVQGRLNLLVGLQNAVVIDDTYNANPDSMRAAIEVLASQKYDSKDTLIFVMGDMGELGLEADDLHAEVGAYAKQNNITRLFSFGQASKSASLAFGENGRHFAGLESLVAALEDCMHAGVCVLVKGSRFMKMERIVNAIVKERKLGGGH
ncbi:MAG: UDP-N-acetylmuramoyl-tripeptide--D-alanyl-D-alanine ligase [Methylophilaceae bacterium]